MSQNLKKLAMVAEAGPTPRLCTYFILPPVAPAASGFIRCKSAVGPASDAIEVQRTLLLAPVP